MSIPDGFTFFRALPPELRLKIWSEALSAPSVWAPDSNASRPVGQAPYLAGLACRESRQLLERLYVKPLPRGLPGGSGVDWVNLETAVVYIGDGAMKALDALGVDELARSCQRLAAVCPALRTIIVEREGDGSAGDGMEVPRTLSPELAAYYATIPDCVGPEMSLETLDTPYFRSLVLEYFGDSPPKLHLVSSTSECSLNIMIPTLNELESAAVQVIIVLKGMSEFSQARIAVIGGLALWKYMPQGGTTEDVDLFNNIDSAPHGVKSKLLNLPNSPFVQQAQFFFLKHGSTLIQIDLTPAWQVIPVHAGRRIGDQARAGRSHPVHFACRPHRFQNTLLRFAAHAAKKRQDAADARNLLEIETRSSALSLTSAQRAAVEPGISDVVAHTETDEKWWRQRLGLL
ncbi:hypothetical protein CSOJ01_08178 [Colletotrichum sojae]|uniref:2EXR domain-containing protein n=1 Tax=Colletotrichum sojae TaxID=2175907 RepID=A0A8H6J6I8_9PEZI|nr:hypothetical protein CSOJ01_08178 [Colletotrichum sojae]